MTEIFFWIGISIVLYTYLGYPVILFFLVKLKRLKSTVMHPEPSEEQLHDLTLVIPCYNEEDYIEEKIKNCLELNYPPNKLSILFVTDGSDDGTNEVIKKYPEVTLSYNPERRGKNAAVNRVIKTIKTPIVVFCDANTMLNKDALYNIARHYQNPKVGGVAGEKRVESADASAAGTEGAYWKYESRLKTWDSELNTVVGAAGELFSIRTELYEEVPKNVLIEDFRLSMNIAKKGLKVVYEPDAYAVETASASIEEEYKRKVRISAGGLREVVYFMPLLNIFKYGMLSFQYVSHRMLRWTLAPLSLVIVLITNILLAKDGNLFFISILIAQLVFYIISLIGHFLRGKDVKIKGFFIPYYFTFMNASVFMGLGRLIGDKQSVVWEKAQRMKKD
ncbi:glycosyltransferase family 2 protein [Fulvivirga sp.]|uniref:glycosyltransferase family 2 protein n=1 Tax=Fulvivirga sp. TaxID=1931237 RepID=UPI0032EEC8DA